MTNNRVIVIFGATGDLAQRMLFPSLYFLDSDGLLPQDVTIIGCSRAKMTDDAFAARLHDSVKERAAEYFSEERWNKLKKRIRHAAVDATDPASFANLRALITASDEVLYYLSTSPTYYAAICRSLKDSGLAHEK